MIQMFGGSTGALTTLTNQLAADVVMTTAGTFYDGPSISLTPGTWLVTVSCHIQNSTAAGAAGCVGRLTTDGATALVSGEHTYSVNSGQVQMCLTWVITVTVTTTIKFQATHHTTSGTAGRLKANTADRDQGANASTMVAVRTAA